MGRLAWYVSWASTEPLYTLIGKPLMSLRTTGSMTVERVAKPLKNSVCTKSRRRLKPKVASILLRTGLNLRFLVESKMRMKLKG